MKEERSWKFKVMLMLKTETLVWILKQEVYIKSGISSMPTSGKVNQEKENWMKSSDSMLKDHSSLFLNWAQTNTWTWLTTETWLWRHQTVETLRYGTSTNKLWQSDLNITTNLGISKAQENQTICRSGVLIQDGGNYSSTLEIRQETLSTYKTLKEFLLQINLIKKDKQLLLLIVTELQVKSGVSCILTRKELLRPKDSMKNSVSTLTDHSTLSQSFHSTELLKASVQIISLLRDGERM